jgi:hypothetical protein
MGKHNENTTADKRNKRMKKPSEDSQNPLLSPEWPRREDGGGVWIFSSGVRLMYDRKECYTLG